MREITIIFFSSWKFAATFPVAVYAMKMSFTETLLYTNIGGIIGALVFFYFSAFLIRLWTKIWPESFRIKRKKKRIFTRSNRRFVSIKMKYGLLGIVLLSPVILSIPLGAFLTMKYYGKKTGNILWLIAGQIFWSLIYTIFLTQVKTVMG
ncbi:MAG: hypothetical protein JW798_10525 [Prolixibacteraceae bacterium]|nr:hypothetical protein [Prolixibacteraceae bacterium]